MAVGVSICAAQLYDKLTNVGKSSKYKPSQWQSASIMQKHLTYALT